VLILGGFLITQEAYGPLVQWLGQRGIRAEVVPVSRLEWLLTTGTRGWRRILDRVDDRVRELAEQSGSGKVTLIGHSSGGVMLRLYLGDQPFAGRIYNGTQQCDRLVTLGSPHQAVRATRLRALVDQRYPGCPFADQVDYVAVAGALDVDGPIASRLARRIARASYRGISGDGSASGDGFVPVGSAHLRGARQLLIRETAHGGLFGSLWYGSPERIGLWWDVVVDPQQGTGP
jgi:hypothetical protein